MTRIAMLGCGYVANMYRLTLGLHPNLILAGVFDLERSRSEWMAGTTGATAYPSFEALLADDSVPVVLNLTNPGAHYETTGALLRAGKHVYSEKPLAMRLDHASELAALSRETGRHLVSAPCTLLNPVAQTLWKLLREEAVGPVRLIYAEMEDGMVHRAPTAKWINEMGVAWPAEDEFRSGCTVEHAGYVLSWLCAMFGPVERLTAHSEVLVPEKLPGERFAAPDHSVATMRFASGPVLRVTNGIYADHDHRLRIFGDDGVIDVEDPRSDRSAIRLSHYRTVRRRRFLSRGRKVPLIGGKETIPAYRGSQTRDFCRAIADLARAVEAGRAPYTGAEYALHLCEVTLAAHYGTTGATEGSDGFDGALARMPYEVRSRFPPIPPLVSSPGAT
ncbi:Gfo/Idh/MocA family oxidoreductase [Roseibacterium sp. SDUM158017]|uniref:Gfo/Idh/MocA family protein n=1 Tax=Roseicyclus salinarum TaxID=3036773 RepID=UPI00241528BE|nr:Gfo/Idh/MocA family oxidoreductase [Roseibacterium sp. SDUM158017]MDG4649610.1 Gfo/Idh/MocA family oxidoreductase [Roseibacterium sp. SDUM158017]